jgi:hypothetical protein
MRRTSELHKVSPCPHENGSILFGGASVEKWALVICYIVEMWHIMGYYFYRPTVEK